MSNFAFQKVLPMKYRCRSRETAIKIARKWGYEKNGIDEKSKNYSAENNFSMERKRYQLSSFSAMMKMLAKISAIHRLVYKDTL